MSDKEVPRDTRLRFFGPDDYGTFFQTEQAYALLDAFDPAHTSQNVNDIVELHHAVQFVDHDLLPKSLTEEERERTRAKIPEIRRTIKKFFSTITDANIESRITDVDYRFHVDVLELLAEGKAFDRCAAPTTLTSLQAAGIRPSELLSCKSLVESYDEEVRSLILSEPRNAEHLIAKFVRADQRRAIYLPPSLTPADSRSLIDAYLDDDAANPNIVGLVATARADRKTGIDDKLRLKARRKKDAFTDAFFEENEGIVTGSEVSIADDQEETALASLEGMVAKYSYSRSWLSENLDYPTILNNFIYVFEFANQHMLLLLPSFYADLGVFERFMETSGKDSYRSGAAFRHKDQTSMLQTIMYDRFLRSNGVEIEEVIAWFFTDYLKDEFGAENFRFLASSATTTYLEKCRHLFSEMESVIKQFSLYVENGELDLELLAMSSKPSSYKDIPSSLDAKYVYLTDQPDIIRIQHLLFSDQSNMCYINEQLQAHSFSQLISENKVAYEDFADHQRPSLDALIDYGVVTDKNGRIRFANVSQFLVLKELNDFEAANYYRYPSSSQEVIDKMVQSGWLERRSSLLTSAESSYMNYFLNQSEFSDGPDLRNRYLHGSQVDGEDDRVHFQTYIIALRLLIALVIKINDDFDAKDQQ